VILVAGATGRLGTQVVRLLVARGAQVRVLTRDLARAEHLKEPGVEVVAGDVRDAASLAAAVVGVQTVVSAVHGFLGPGGVSPGSVDDLGNANLIGAAEAADVEHFVLISVVGAAPDHPMELFRMKHRAERRLMASRLGWTVIRATAFMELWAGMIGDPLLRSGKTLIFGRGDNPINFVSVGDVAVLVEHAVADAALRATIVEVGGPENLSFNQMARMFESLSGRPARVTHVPRTVMRLASLLAWRVRPDLARQIRAGVVMDTADMRFDAAELLRRYPSMRLTTLAEVARRSPADRDAIPPRPLRGGVGAEPRMLSQEREAHTA
jgi:uncharacterized protein YbjT (DUF2867 family)